MDDFSLKSCACDDDDEDADAVDGVETEPCAGNTQGVFVNHDCCFPIERF